MSAQRLSPRSIRRIERSIGEPVVMAWAHGGYWMSFLTLDHRHGAWDKKTGSVEWSSPDEPLLHYSTCQELLNEYAKMHP